MSHYWTGSENEAIRREQALDWLEDLREFGPAIVAEACTRWRRQPGGRRPTPGDIRTFCIEERRDQRLPALTGGTESPTWPSWQYDLWGPASTGRIARQNAIEAQQALYQRAENERLARAHAPLARDDPDVSATPKS